MSQSAKLDISDRRPITAEAKKALENIGYEFQAAIEARKEADKLETELKAKIKAIVTKYDLPIDGGVTQYLNFKTLPGIALAVTRPNKELTIDPQKLLDAIGPDLFHKVCTVKSVAVNLEVWDFLVKEERVKDSVLMDCANLPDANSTGNEGLRITLVAERATTK